MLAHPFTRPKASSISCLSRVLFLAMANVTAPYPGANFLYCDLRDLVALGSLAEGEGQTPELPISPYRGPAHAQGFPYGLPSPEDLPHA